MARNEVFKYGEWVSLPVNAATASGSPMVVGELVGVCQTKEGEGGNAAGFASVALEGVFEFTVAFASATYGLPVYINTTTYALTATTATGLRLFGHTMSTKSAPSGPLRVRLAHHAPGAQA